MRHQPVKLVTHANRARHTYKGPTKHRGVCEICEQERKLHCSHCQGCPGWHVTTCMTGPGAGQFH